MKHLLFTSAISLALALPAFANDSTIDQIGLGNFADVDQTGGNGGTSLIEQTGDNDLASVLQSDGGGSGTNNAIIRQLEGSNVQEANITQNNGTSGAENFATIVQDSIQGGNLANINQDGAGNQAVALQGPGASDDLVFPTFFGTIVRPTTPGDITNSESSINQLGNGNTASTAQVVGSNGGDNNLAGITQTGDDNSAAILQGTGTGSTIFGPALSANDNDNIANILQDGIGNDSSIAQGGESGFASNTQTGNDNSSVIVQSGGTPFFGNSAVVSQTGNDNESEVFQTSSNGDLPIVPDGTTASVTQNGDDNFSTISQKPLGGHLATVLQTGNGGFSLIEQDGLLNTATLTQGMEDNTSEIFQTGPSVVGPVGNTATVMQTATSGNFSTVSQSGVLNTSTVMQ